MSKPIEKIIPRASVDKDLKTLEALVYGLNDLKKRPPTGFQIQLAVNSATGLLTARLIKTIGEE